MKNSWLLKSDLRGTVGVLKSFYDKNVPGLTLPVKFPKFCVKKLEGMIGEQIVDEVERKSISLIGIYLHKEHEQALKTLRHGGKINRVFDEMGVSYGPRTRPSTASKKMILAGNIGSEIPETKSKKKKKASKKFPDTPKPPTLRIGSSSTVS